MIENHHLKDLLLKGPKYREKERIRWDKVSASITQGIHECQKTWQEPSALTQKYSTNGQRYSLIKFVKRLQRLKRSKNKDIAAIR